jgi:50S ribosomal subunit-associated GTPase HflX
LRGKKVLTVANKVDLLVKSMEDLSDITATMNLPAPDSVVVISAVKDWGLDTLLGKICENLSGESLRQVE